jgi:hypothetical protein
VVDSNNCVRAGVGMGADVIFQIKQLTENEKE